MTKPTEAPKPKPPVYSAEAEKLAKRHHLDPRTVQQMIEKGIVKL